ncbi:MAG TPA: MFS transporter [Polyangiaceae bacterium]|nr:MFS transporter [Polyangiaceae bacterium]
METTTSWWREPTRGQWATFGAAWFGWVLDAFDFSIFVLVIEEMQKEFGVTNTAAGWTITLTLVLRLVGAYFVGSLADRWGRKIPLMMSIVWFALCDGAIAFAPSFTWILVLRTLFGLGMGAEWAVGATLAMENWPERSRGIASGLLQAGWPVGYLLASQVTRFVVPELGWRPLFLLAALPALLVLPIRAWVPESSEWRRAKGSVKKESLHAQLRPLAWGVGVMALAFSAYYALYAPYPKLLRAEVGMSLGSMTNHIALFNIGMLVGAIGCGAIAARKGPLWAIVPPALLTLPILPLYVASSGALTPWLPVGAFLGGLIGAGYSGVAPLLLTRLFPAAVRARCVGFVYNAGAFPAAFVPTAIFALGDHASIPLGRSVAFVAGGCQLALAALLLWRPPPQIVEPDPVPVLAEARHGAS